jgi:hypothetical protein
MVGPRRPQEIIPELGDPPGVYGEARTHALRRGPCERFLPFAPSLGLRKQAHLKKSGEEVCREEVQPEASDHTY